MRVLVCGSRDFTNTGFVYETLDRLSKAWIDPVIIEGDARGVDRIAGYWAKKHGYTLLLYPADWSMGKRAGPLRNKKMLEEGKPDLVIAFPGEKGTANMVKLAKEAGVEVLEISIE